LFNRGNKLNKTTYKMKATNLSNSINMSSPLHHFREKNDEKAVNMLSMMKDKSFDQPLFEAEKVQEMEERARSRLSEYDPADSSLKQDDLSKSYHSISYCASPCPGNISTNSPAQHSLNASWQFFNFMGGSAEIENNTNSQYKKPTQAIVTINARTSRILITNETACDLFGYTDEELCGKHMKVSQLFTMEDGVKQNVLIEQNIDKEGNIVMVSGKVLEATNKKGDIFMVSVWMKRIQAGSDVRCVLIMEPVDVNKGSFLFDAAGTISDCDFTFALLHGYEDPQDLIGKNIDTFVPSFQLPSPGQVLSKDIKKQRVTSRTKDLVPFPSTIKVRIHDPEFHQLYMERTAENKRQMSKFLYKGFLWVFSNVSGLMTIDNKGLVTSCNENFLRIFLGYFESELMGKEITTLIPYFYEQIDMLHHGSIPQTPSSSIKRSCKKDDLVIECLDGPPATTKCGLDDTDLEEGEIRSTKNDSGINDESESLNDQSTPLKDERLNNRGTPLQEEHLDSRGTPLRDEICLNNQDTPLKDECLDNTGTPLNDEICTNKLNNCVSHQANKKDKLDGFSPHTISTPVSDEKRETNIDRIEGKLTDQITEKQKLDFGQNDREESLRKTDIVFTDPVKIKDGAVVKDAFVAKDTVSRDVLQHKQIKTSDYESLSSSIVDDVLSRLSKNTELCNEQKTRVCASKATSQNFTASEQSGLSDLVFEDCKKEILEKDKGDLSKIYPGQYYGQARHKDGSMLPILFEIKKWSSKSKNKDNNNGQLFCLWMSRDPDEETETYGTEKHKQLLASFNSTMTISTGNFQEMLKEIQDMKLEDPGSGLYNDKFNTARCIGKGAFGFVNLAERKSDNEQVVVKFIRKEKVLKDSWIDDASIGRTPYEVHLLSKLQHPNVVKVLEVYENDCYVHMVMEKHGDGIDLFEFIDRKPLMDEALASYMFRQVLSATDYLHQNKILHRDIKDENIIVDRSFHLKLIDFGSAAPLEKDKYFTTFCGTIEYCSPEVLLGNSYRGPELEMWSLGVTLYTFIFGEHPFFEVEDSIRAELFPPFKVSNELMFVVCWMLHPDVQFRARLPDLIKYPWFTRDVTISNYDYDTVLSGVTDEPDNNTENLTCQSPRKSPHSNATGNQSHKKTMTSSSHSSTSSSMTSSSSFSSLDDLASSHDSELERNKELMKEEYKRYLEDPNSTEISNAVLSKSF
uniref:Uncharacterized protein n=1 Tax=Clytia hemisphaerica TaxID=252671 RepID=A0A7M5V6U5_9CNID